LRIDPECLQNERLGAPWAGLLVIVGVVVFVLDVFGVPRDHLHLHAVPAGSQLDGCAAADLHDAVCDVVLVLLLAADESRSASEYD
jgi:hypothetical protein